MRNFDIARDDFRGKRHFVRRAFVHDVLLARLICPVSVGNTAEGDAALDAASPVQGTARMAKRVKSLGDPVVLPLEKSFAIALLEHVT